jgi:AcrR family transcriptional regulator
MRLRFGFDPSIELRPWFVYNRQQMSSDLPIAVRPERADAARNRRRILDAARELFGRHGVDGVSLERVAAEAGVSKATLFRRFGDRQALFLALLDEHERELQDALIAGPPPLGPGAPAGERLHAFVDALLQLSLDHREFLLASETARPLARLTTGAYDAWHRHATLLLGNRPLDAHLLLAAFDAELLTAVAVADPASYRATLHALADCLGGE